MNPTATILQHGLAVTLLGLISQYSSMARDATNSFDFKQFVASPPMLEEFVFTSQKPGSALGTNSLPEPKCVRARWQSRDSFMLGVAPRCEDLYAQGTGRMRAEWYGAGPDMWWHLSCAQSNQYVVRIWETDTPSELRINPVVTTVNAERHLDLDQALSLGVAHVPPVGLKWSGDLFYFTNATDNVVGSGSIVRDGKGRPVILRHAFSKPIDIDGVLQRRTFSHHVEYEYEDSTALPVGFPSAMNVFLEREGKLVFHIERVRFVKVAIATAGIGSMAYVPLVGNAPLVKWVTRNDVEHVQVGKEWKPIPEPPASEPRGQVAPWKLAFVGLLLIMPMIILFRALKTRKT